MDAKFTRKKEIVFDIALEMFAYSGFENVTLEAIATKAGFKMPAIYYYFPSKDDILVNIFQYFTEHFYDNVKPVEEISKLLEKSLFLKYALGIPFLIFSIGASHLIRGDGNSTFAMICVTIMGRCPLMSANCL